MATPASLRAAPQAQPAKLPRAIRTQADIRQSARGQDCHMRLDGVCCHDPSTVVWSHWPGLDGGRGMGLKSVDIAGCYTCVRCHDAIDGRAPLPAGMMPEALELAWHRGHLRSLETLYRIGYCVTRDGGA
jgi:hypothetical protein